MRVLIIEDNPDIAANIGDYLDDKGHTVDFAGDGITGLHLAIVNDFDAIVLDLALPGMDGLEVCRKLRQVQIAPFPQVGRCLRFSSQWTYGFSSWSKLRVSAVT